MSLSLLILAILLLDLLTKYLARIHLAGGPGITLIEDFFSLTYVENRGAAFGLFSQKTYGPLLLLALACFLTLILVKFLSKLRYRPLRYGLCLIISGSLGNTIDRLLRGFVTDFLTFKFGSWYFPSFNLADTAIVLGCIFLAALLLWDPKAQADLDRVLGHKAEERADESRES